MRLAVGILLAAALTSGAAAQEPRTEPTQDPPPAEPDEPAEPDQPAEPVDPGEPVDPAERAAEALRRLLRGEQPPTRPEEVKPGVEIPPGPEPTEEPTTDPTAPVAPPPQDPERPASPEIDAARRALERLDPTIKPVEKPAEEVRDDPAVASDPGESPSEPVALEVAPLSFSGFLTLDWRLRRSSTDSKDQDVRALLGFDVGDALSDDVTLHFLGRGQLDIDGPDAGDFSGVQEAIDDKFWGRVYEAWLDFNRMPDMALFRLGRQPIVETPEVLYLDGVRAETESFGDARTFFGGYIGLPTRWFDDSTGKLLAGLYGESRPWQKGRVRLDWIRAEDARDGREFDDDLLGLGLWQGIGDSALLHGRYTLLNGSSRDLVLRGDADFEEAAVRSTIGYTELLSTQSRLAIEFDPFYDQAFELYPYRQLSANVTKGLLDWSVDLTGGLDVRRLTDIADEGQFNRDFERYYLTLFWNDIGGADVSASITFDAYDADSDETTAWSADVSAGLGGDWRGVIGSDYSLYDYDFFSQEERDRVRTFFVRFDYEPVESLRFRLDYRYEDVDHTDRYHVVETRMTWNF